MSTPEREELNVALSLPCAPHTWYHETCMPHLLYRHPIPGTLIIGSWLVFIAYWFISSLFAKRSVRFQKRRFGANAFHIELVIAVLAISQLPWAHTRLLWQPDFGSFWPWIGAMTQALVQLASDVRSTAAMGARARTMLEAHFTRRHAFERWRDVLDHTG
jgi:hypothetical protein